VVNEHSKLTSNKALKVKRRCGGTVMHHPDNGITDHEIQGITCKLCSWL